MAKDLKTRKGKDNIYYPYTSPDIVIDSTGESQTTKNTSMKTDIDNIKTDLGTAQLTTNAKDVKGAINELFQSVSNGKSLIARAITDKGVTTLATDTFEQMANNIRQIITDESGDTNTYTSQFANVLYNTTKWQVFGDSISTTYNVNENQIWHNLITVDKQFSTITKYNNSLTGSEVSDGGRNIASFVERYTSLHSDADLVTIFGGVNDWAHNNIPLGNYDDTTTNKSFYGALNTLLPGIKSQCPSARIIWLSPLKTKSNMAVEHTNVDGTNTLGLHLTDYIQAIKYKCNQYSIEFVDLYGVTGLDPDTNTSNFASDGLHPTPTGHVALKDYLLNTATVSVPTDKYTGEEGGGGSTPSNNVTVKGLHSNNHINLFYAIDASKLNNGDKVVVSWTYSNPSSAVNSFNGSSSFYSNSYENAIRTSTSDGCAGGYRITQAGNFAKGTSTTTVRDNTDHYPYFLAMTSFGGLSTGSLPITWTIDSISVTVNDVEVPILGAGGFFTDEDIIVNYKFSTGGDTGDTNINCTGISLDRTSLELGVFNRESGEETTSPITTTWTQGYILRNGTAVSNGTVGDISESSGDRTSDFIDISNTSKLDFTLKSAVNIGAVAYDENKKWVAIWHPANGGENGTWKNQGINSDTRATKMVVTDIPKNAKYIKVCFSTADPSTQITSMTKTITAQTETRIDKYQLVTTITPTNCTDKVTWSVSPTGVCTVNDGLVTAVANGQAIVTAKCGNYSANCNVTVSGMTPPETSYTVTNNLSNCSTSNNNASVNSGYAYLSTITPDSGYSMSSITVTMGGTDITSTVVSGNNINIPSVTGNIVITANATTQEKPEQPPQVPDSEEYATYMAEMNNNYTANQQYTKEDETGAYVIPLSTYSISNNGTNANATTKGINNALQYAKNNGYSKVKLPAGTYLIDPSVKNTNDLGGWTHTFTGVYVPSNITLIMEGATLKMMPNVEDPYAHVVNLSNSDNAKIIGGTIIGDRETHDYGTRINNNGGEFERGDINTSTGANATGVDCIRTKNFVTNIPSKFHVTPLWNTTRNTVDGSEIVVYFYNASNSLVSTKAGDFLTEFTLPSGATKLKLVIKQETRLDAVVSITSRTLYYTYEFGCGICVTGSDNVVIRGVKIFNCNGDCIGTNAPPNTTTKKEVNDLVIENCTLENSRRQGISFVATGDRPIVRNCNIGKINGVDPQCGIDFEHYDHVDNAIVEGCNFYDNKKWDIINYISKLLTIRNNYFNGAVAFTYGYNMDIYNNKFLFKDHNINNIYKSYNEIMYFNQWGTSFEEKKAYYNVHDNVFIGFNGGYNNTSLLSNTNNHYNNNTFINCNWLRMQYTEANTFKNCTIEYIFDSNKTLDACTFTDCTIYKRSAYTLETSKCKLNNSTVKDLTSTSTTPSSINIPSTFSIKQGESKTIPMMIMPTTALRDGEPLTKEVRWESSDWSKVYVSEIGTVYAIGNPEGVTITCTSRANANAKGTCILNGTSKEIACTGVRLNNSTLTFINTTPQTLTATLTPSNTTDKVVWSVNPTGICTVNNGVVTPVKNGQCVVTATCGSHSATCNVTVSGLDNPEPPSIDDSDAHVIDIASYGIKNDNTNAKETTLGINNALKAAKAAGHTKVKLPAGTYAIDAVTDQRVNNNTYDGKTYSYNGRGITMLSDMTLILTDCTLQQEPNEIEPDTRVITLKGCENTHIVGGTIIGDRYTHDYGMRINEEGNLFESGDINSSGQLISDETKVRTKDYITNYIDWSTKEVRPLPNAFRITPLWNTSMNTVDGGCRYIHCYDSSNNYLGLADTNGNGYLAEAVLPENTAKIKITLKGEKRTDVVLALTTLKLHYTYEFGNGVLMDTCKNSSIQNMIIKDCTGDCAGTGASLFNGATIDDCQMIGCTLENARRQGFSLTGAGNNFLIKDCNIGKINGVDPQCGIDSESYGITTNTVIDGCKFYSNKKWDIVNYDGTNMEIKNCNFAGAISTANGHTMNIHHNTFEYKPREEGDSTFPNTNLNLNTKNNIVHDNTFIGGTVVNAGEGCENYNNIYRNAKPTVTTPGANKYYSCDVNINSGTQFTTMEGSYFENCNVTLQKDEPGITLTTCEFKNSTCSPRGATVMDRCTFDMTDKSVFDGWKTDATSATYKHCTFKSTYNSRIPLLGASTKFLATFENCDFNISRYWLGDINKNFTFNSCNFIFNDINKSTDTCYLNTHDGNSSWTRDYWYFNSCFFKSSLPVEISGGHIVDPTTEGSVTTV